MKNNKSKHRLAKELVKKARRNTYWFGGSRYDVADYDYQNDEDFEAVSEDEVIEALCENLTKSEMRELYHEETEIRLRGTYEGFVVVENTKLGWDIELIYLGRLARADEPVFSYV